MAISGVQENLFIAHDPQRLQRIDPYRRKPERLGQNRGMRERTALLDHKSNHPAVSRFQNDRRQQLSHRRHHSSIPRQRLESLAALLVHPPAQPGQNVANVGGPLRQKIAPGLLECVDHLVEDRRHGGLGRLPFLDDLPLHIFVKCRVSDQECVRPQNIGFLASGFLFQIGNRFGQLVFQEVHVVFETGNLLICIEDDPVLSGGEAIVVLEKQDPAPDGPRGNDLTCELLRRRERL